MASKVADQKASLIADLTKQLEGAKLPEQKLALLSGALETAEAYTTHIRGVLNDVLQAEPEGKIYEIDGYPHKRSQVRGSGKDGAPVRYTIRSLVSQDLKEHYSFAKKG